LKEINIEVFVGVLAKAKDGNAQRRGRAAGFIKEFFMG
jgi:hypothetical protein